MSTVGAWAVIGVAYSHVAVVKRRVMAGRYDAVCPEAEFQAGSRGRVLRNRLGITSVRELERQESERLLATTQRSIDETGVDQRFVLIRRASVVAARSSAARLPSPHLRFATSAAGQRLWRMLDRIRIVLSVNCFEKRQAAE
jgi:hypothetical protein